MSLILSGTDGLSDVDGTAATPAIRGTDANTGIFFPAADTIAFSEGGAEVARFDSSSNLLVGSSSSYAGKFQSWGAVTANSATPNISAIDTTSVASGVGGELTFFGQYTSGSYAYMGSIRGIKENGTSNNTACALTFYTRPDATAPSERMRIDSSGNVGIGTSSPLKKLDVSVSTTASIGQYLRNSTINLLSLIDGTSSAQFGTETSHPLLFLIGNVERARFDSSGNLGIGTSSPSSKLSVAGNITLLTASPTISTALNDNFDIKATNAGGQVRIFSGNSLAIECNAGQAITMPNLAGAGTRSVNANASGTLSAASDSRLKQEVEGQTLPSLAEVMKLEVKAYKWLDDINVRGADAAVEIGFFADQVAPIIPSAAPMGRDGYYGFYDRSVIAALVNAIKEQQALITQLQADVAALKGA